MQKEYYVKVLVTVPVEITVQADSNAFPNYSLDEVLAEAAHKHLDETIEAGPDDVVGPVTDVTISYWNDA